ncbi:hypothetical protein LUZ60_017663 [Juncus effusus]|nr:hypothetical protein LUZ60_017663 [Juncus effusus]
MAKGLVVGLLAAFLVVAMVIGGVIGVVYNTKKAGSDFSAPPETSSTLSTTSKSLTVLCMPALHKESCEQTLSQASSNGSASPTVIFKHFAENTMKELESAFRRSADITKGKDLSNDSRTTMAASDCKKLLEESKDDMKGLTSLIGNDMKSFTADSDNIKQSLTAAMTFMDNCIDGFEDPKLKS